MKLVSIPARRFLMGSPTDEKQRQADEAQHEVELTKGFWLGKYEVTQEEYEKVMGSNPSQFKGPKLPVEQVSWEDAKEFCKKLSAKEGKEYTLPTEAEWEYACRAGMKGPFSTGENLTTAQGNYNGEISYAGNPKGLNRGKTIEVGSFASNGYGVHDMHGNVWEWCEDWQGAYETKGVAVDPKGPSEGFNRGIRGGSWNLNAGYCRSADRLWDAPTRRSSSLGFRVALRTVK